ncbi:MAG: metallophosphoesterase [Kiritimatiellae bacterium]|nr:metallophosphoesterase [Kiritimatiellia bacterium]
MNANVPEFGPEERSTPGDGRKAARLLTGVVVLAAVALAFGLHAETAGSPPAGAGGFRVQPYILNVTQAGATVAFHLEHASPAAVLLYEEEGREPRVFESTEPGTSHFIAVNGLEPGRAYRYAVRAAGAVLTPPGDTSYQIRTACRPGEAFRFAVYGDPRPGDTRTHRHHEAIVAQILQQDPMFALLLGDLVDDGRRAEGWEDFFRIESALARRAALYPVRGDNDHAGGDGVGPRYFPALARAPYHFEWGGVHFFGMCAWDTRGAQPRSELDATSDQIRWLERELAREEVQKAPFRIVFTHDPVYISRGRSSEVLRRHWAPLFERYRVDVVFASWHLYERSVRNGVQYVISGGAGAELIFQEADPGYPAIADANRHHFCLVDVAAGSLALSAVADDGTVLDAITLRPRSAVQSEAGETRRMARRLRREYDYDGGAQAPELLVHLFSRRCPYCEKLLNRVLPRAARQHAVSIRVHYYDLDQRRTYDLLTAIESDFGRQGAEIPAIFAGCSVLGGEAEIGAGLARELEAFRRNPIAYQRRAVTPFGQAYDLKSLQERKFRALTLGLVLGAGLLDGVNPCAFTTLIFLISYLALVGSSRRQMVVTGGLFTGAVFGTYLAIGLLLFEVAAWISARHVWATVVNAVLLLAVTALAAISAVDFWRCLRGRATESALQLPAVLKTHIRDRIRTFARYRVGIAAAAFALGVVIAGLELACTGQVYFPIVTMIADPRFRGQAVGFLLAYNAAFAAPLVVVFLLATLGVTSEQVGRVFRRHLALVKLGLTFLFAAMAGLVLYNLVI